MKRNADNDGVTDNGVADNGFADNGAADNGFADNDANSDEDDGLQTESDSYINDFYNSSSSSSFPSPFPSSPLPVRYTLERTSLRFNEFYHWIYRVVAYDVFKFIVPFAALVLLNYHTISTLRLGCVYMQKWF